MPSFDIVSNVDAHELINAIDQANREIDNRFDFKGTNARFDLADHVITLRAQNAFQLQQMQPILDIKFTKRGIDVACLDRGAIEESLHEARQVITVKQGVDQDTAKKIVKLIKDAKLKVQVAILGDQVRVTGKKRDDLQTVIALLREQKLGLPLQYTNFRE